MLLGDGVLSVRRNGNSPQASPESDIFPDVSHLQRLESLILESHMSPCMASLTFQFFRVEASKMSGAGFFRVNPRGIPKGRTCSVANGDVRGCIE